LSIKEIKNSELYLILRIEICCRSHYIHQADFAAEELEEEIERVLAQQAKETCQMLVNGKYQVNFSSFSIKVK
jgi:hypothetical protein